LLNAAPVGQQPLILDGFWQVFTVGCLGGVIGDLVIIFEARRDRPPEYTKKKFYWLCVILMTLAGGVLTCFYGLHGVQAILALNIGASAPLILKSFATGTPPINPPKVD